MRIRLAAVLIALVVLPVRAGGGDTPRLDIVATAATAQVLPGADGRRAVDVGTLRFRFQVLYACRATERADSLTLTIADSSTRAGADALAGRAAEFEVELPGAQLAPVRVADFCVAGRENADGEPPRTVASLVTASASLRCVDASSDESDDEPDGASGARTVYRSAPLDVVLVCDRTAADPPGPAAD